MKVTIRVHEKEDKLVIYFGSLNRKLSGTCEPGVNLFFTPLGKIGRLEIYPASELLGTKDLTRINFGQLVGLAEVANIMKVKKPNFIRDFIKTNRFPKPIVELASGKIWDIEDVENFKESYRPKTKNFINKLRRKNGK